MPSTRALPSAYDVDADLRSPRGFLQRDGFSEVGAPEILEIEPLVHVRHRGSELDPDVRLTNPADVALDEGPVEESQKKFFAGVRNGPVENADLGAGFGEIDQVANTRCIAKLDSDILVRGVSKVIAPVRAPYIRRGDDIPA